MRMFSLDAMFVYAPPQTNRGVLPVTRMIIPARNFDVLPMSRIPDELLECLRILT
jgi:hypothetical protein